MRKRVLFYALAVVVAFICIGMPDLSSAFVCGDANGDASVNVSDAVYIINYVFVGGDPTH
jgi:hypothetical protein